MNCLQNVKKSTLQKIANAGKKKNQPSKKKKGGIKKTDAKSKKLIIPDGGVPLTKQQIKAMNPKTLKAHLTARSLETQGNKKELMARLLEAVSEDAEKKGSEDSIQCS